MTDAMRETDVFFRSTDVDRILVKNGRTVGVALKNGDEYFADVVVSNLDPKRTFLDVMDASDLPADVVKKAENFKIRGSSGKRGPERSGSVQGILREHLPRRYRARHRGPMGRDFAHRVFGRCDR